MLPTSHRVRWCCTWLPRWLQSDTDPWSCLVQGSPGHPPTWRCMIQTNFLHNLGTILSDHTCISDWLAGLFSSLSLSLSHKTCMIWTVSDTDRQTESIAYLSSQRCDRLGEAQLCPWDRRVGVKASVDPRAHVHPPAPQVPYSPLFPVQADTARTAPSSKLSPQHTRIFLLLLFFLLTPTREMQSKCNDKTAQQHHTRESTTFDPQHQTQVLHSTKETPLTALPIRRSANPNFATYAATSAAPMRGDASRRASRVSIASARELEGQTDSRQDRAVRFAVCCTTAWLSCDSMDTPRG
jgi:hypothetical protein